MFLLMGIFSIYCGMIYNEFFAIPIVRLKPQVSVSECELTNTQAWFSIYRISLAVTTNT